MNVSECFHSRSPGRAWPSGAPWGTRPTPATGATGLAGRGRGLSNDAGKTERGTRLLREPPAPRAQERGLNFPHSQLLSLRELLDPVNRFPGLETQTPSPEEPEDSSQGHAQRPL